MKRDTVALIVAAIGVLLIIAALAWAAHILYGVW